MSSPHLYLVDGSSYIFRAFHRLPPLTNKFGLNVGAVYGYTTMLWKLAESLNKADGPTHLAVILDASESTFRNQMYDQYKANRPPPPPELVPQFPLIRDATRAFSIPCLEEDGLEADDIIACYAKAAVREGWQVTIVSSDKDLMQLIEPGVDMLDTMNDRRIGREEVIEKFGVGPEKVGEVLALMGDSVDNVPGVPGIGPKTASKLIQEFGDVEAVLAAAPGMKPSKMRDNLIEHADKARLSRQLVELICDSPLPEPLGALAMKGIPEEPLREFLEYHGFRTLLARLGAQTQAAAAPTATETTTQREVRPEPKIDRSLYETVTTEEALDRWIAEAEALGRVAFDTETDGRDCVSAKLVGISLATQCNKACYIPLEHGGDDMFAERPDQLPSELVLSRLKPLFEDPAVLKIGHNLKFDWVILEKRGIRVAPYGDTLVMSFNLDAGGLNSHSLDDLAKKHLDHICIAFKELCGTGQKQITFNLVQLDRATEYAAEDADVALRLWLRFRARLPFERATRIYEMVDRPMVAVVGAMELGGVKVDREVLKGLSGEFNIQIAALEEKICGEAGCKFTIGSPQQLGEILFKQMGLSGGRKGKSGVYSTDQNELERLEREGVPIARLVLEWRQLTKLKSTYTDALQEQINKETGRVHTSYSLSGAQTGRLASTDPNLMNIPIRTEIGRRIRDAFIAEPGHVMLSADYSQIELRLAAHICDVPPLKEAFEAGEDIHNRTAQELFGTVDRDTRGRAKTINFAILYGISRWGLAQRLEISPDEAQAMIDRYFERFPGIRAYIGETLTQARETGFTTTLFGRKTHFPRIKSNVQHERQGAERAAINAPIQGTAADIIKRAMARIGPALAEKGLNGTRMLMQVHDELVFEVPEGEVEGASAVIREVMADAAAPAIHLTVPLGVEIGTGPNWGAAHSTAAAKAHDSDIAALAKGGRTNFFGFLLRLAARIPFLFIAGRFYGPELLGRFAYAVIVMELCAQLATLGLKRGLAQQLSTTDQPHVCVVMDGLLAAFIASAIASAVLMVFPQAMFPAGDIRGAEWLLPLVIFGIAGADVALAALAYRHDVASTVQVRALVEPWVISIAAGALIFTQFHRDGLIIAYVASVVAGLLAAMWRLFRSYGRPRGWKPNPAALNAVARRNVPLAAADAIEWFSRRLDIAILGLFVAPQYVGLYYVAQQVASMPQKLKTSFDPILAPVITQKLAEGDKIAVARQVRQVGFWIIAAQAAIALSLGIPGEALMGLFGEKGVFVGGTAALTFLLVAEVVAATAAVSEAALVYVARHKNLMISLLTIATQALLTVGIIVAMRAAGWSQAHQAAGAALALALALGLASILKARLLARLLGAPVQGWRWSLIWAAAAAGLVGFVATRVPEWLELSVGAPLILVTFGAMIWYRGFTDEDRVLFRRHRGEEPTLPVKDIATP